MYNRPLLCDRRNRLDRIHSSKFEVTRVKVTEEFARAQQEEAKVTSLEGKVVNEAIAKSEQSKFPTEEEREAIIWREIQEVST